MSTTPPPAPSDVPPQEAPAWAAARTLPDAGELIAQWLERRRTWSPVHDSTGPTAETGSHLIAALTAANRAGYVTDNSQPGIDQPGLAQRAFVSGTLAPAHAWYAEYRALGTDLVAVIGHRSTDRRRTHPAPTTSIALTVIDGEPTTFGGRYPSRTEDPLLHAPLAPLLRRALRASDRLEVFDPSWGRDDLLWPWLHELAEDLTDGTADAWIRSRQAVGQPEEDR
jgi:hypothetical protein